VPSELTKALEGVGGALGGLARMGDDERSALVREHQTDGESPEAVQAREAAEAAAAEAAAAAAKASAEVSGGDKQPALAPAVPGNGAVDTEKTEQIRG
jgi:hypothetical protein